MAIENGNQQVTQSTFTTSGLTQIWEGKNAIQ